MKLDVRSANIFPFLIAIDLEPRFRSPSTSMASPAISSPRSMRKACNPKNQTILLAYKTTAYGSESREKVPP